MSPERERQILEVVAEALAHAPESRHAFLIQNIDSTGLDEAQSLLEFQSRTGLLDGAASTRTLRGFVAGAIVGDRFRIIRLIGQGGMGDVYEAVDLVPSRQSRVALKTVRPEIASNPRMAEQFEREIEIGKTITHPNVCRIYDLGLHRDPPDEDTPGVPKAPTMFLTMELLEGHTLAEHLREKVLLEPSDALPIISQVADGLRAAHEAHIVHRDLKPGNIMLVPIKGRTGFRAVVTDFGLARELADPSGAGHMTAAGAGTPDYMSPEQVRGDPIGPVSDIYSLGVVAYQMVTGHLPFEGEQSLVRMVRRLHEPPVAPRTYVPSLPPCWENALMQCLEREPANRFATTRDLISALEGQSLSPGSNGAAPSDEPIETHDVHKGRINGPSHPFTFLQRLKAAPNAALFVVAMVLVSMAWFYRGSIISQFDIHSSQKRVAVLKFENVGGDQTNQLFCDGLLETSTSMLTQVDSLRQALLITPASEIRKQSVNSAGDARRIFGATLVITGSVQRNADNVVITANLIDSKNLHQIRSQTMHIRSSELASIQENIVACITDLLALELKPNERRRIASYGTGNPAANDSFLQGSGYLKRFEVPRNIDKGIEALERAVQLDPAFVMAQVALGTAYRQQYTNTHELNWLDKARVAANHAVSSAPDFPPAQAAFGDVELAMGNSEKALEHFRRAKELDSFNIEAIRGLAQCYETAGMLKEAEETYKHAIDLRPQDWYTRSLLGVFYSDHSRYREAASSMRELVNLAPDNWLVRRNLGGVYMKLGLLKEAEQELLQSIRIEPTGSAYSNLGALYIYAGQYGRAVPVLEKALAMSSPNQFRAYVLWFNLGDAYRWNAQSASRAPDAYSHALGALESLLANDPSNMDLLSMRAVIFAKLGRRESALADIAKALRSASGNSKFNFRAAIVYELGGERDLALAALDQAIRSGYSREEIDRDPELANLRKDQRYLKLGKRT